MRGLDDAGVGVEPAHHRANEIEPFGIHVAGLVDHHHVGELDLLHQQIDQGAGVLGAGGLAAILQELVRAVIFRRFTASTTVTIVSSRATSQSACPASSRNEKVEATGSGSAMPVPSISR